MTKRLIRIERAQLSTKKTFNSNSRIPESKMEIRDDVVVVVD